MPDNKPISERDLILPALFCINNEGEISTTLLSQQLRNLLNPQGEDREILSGRNDDKFSQKVRNLRSHETLEKAELANYESRNGQGYWTITDKGKSLLEDNLPLLDYLMQQKFDYSTQQEALSKIRIGTPNKQEDANLFEEDVEEKGINVAEGKVRTASLKIYERSAKLRDAAIRHFTIDGSIPCRVCGFDFAKIYGTYGEGFIEIHHLKPVFSYGDEGIEKTLDEALSNLVPLCSNCHRMIHRKRDRMLTIEELKQFFEDAKHNQ